MIQPVNALSFKAIYNQPGGRFTEKELDLIVDIHNKMKTPDLKITKGSRLIDYLDVKDYHLLIKPGTFKDTVDISLSKGVSFNPDGIKLHDENFVGTFSEDKEFLPEYVENTYRRDKAKKDFNKFGMISMAVIVTIIILGTITTLKNGINKINQQKTTEVVTDTLKTLQKDTLDVSKKLIK